MQTFLEYVKGLNKKLIDTFGLVKVYTVNGQKVRQLDLDSHEFTDYGIHSSYPKLIPKNEIWVNEITKPQERWLLIHTALHRIRLGSKDDYTTALKQERKLRETLSGVKFHPERTDEPAPKQVYVKKYGIVGDPDDKVEVWLVNATYVRNRFKTDYVEGGHGYVYKWVPNGEIWLESTMHENELPLILLHEYVERCLMKLKHMSYDKAHTIASKVEFAHEKKFTKPQAIGLSSKAALRMADRF